MERFKIGEWGDFKIACYKNLGNDFPIEKSVDSLMTYINGYVTLDMDVVIDFLNDKGWRDESMESFVSEKFGNDALNFLKAVLL